MPESNLTQFLSLCKTVNGRSITLKLFTPVHDQDKAVAFILQTLGFFFFGLGLSTVFPQSDVIMFKVTLVYTNSRIINVTLMFRTEEEFCGCVFRLTHFFLHFPKPKSILLNNPRSLFLVAYFSNERTHHTIKKLWIKALIQIKRTVIYLLLKFINFSLDSKCKSVSIG